MNYLKQVNSLRMSISKVLQRNWKDIDPVDRDGRDTIMQRYFRLYRDVTHYTALIAKSRNKLFFHFIQPNQYDSGSKQLSIEERTLYLSHNRDITHAYNRLDELSRKLRLLDVESHSLRMVFKNNSETLRRIFQSYNFYGKCIPGWHFWRPCHRWLNSLPAACWREDFNWCAEDTCKSVTADAWPTAS